MWNCPSCTLLNNNTLLHCTLCSTPRPAPQLPQQIPISMTNNDGTPQQQQSQQSSVSPNISSVITPQHSKQRKSKRSWKKVSSASTILQFEYSDTRTSPHYNSNAYPTNNNNNNNGRTASIDNMANYGFDDYEYNDMESIIASSTISHGSSKNLKQLTRHSIYKNTYDAAADSKFKSKSNAAATTSTMTPLNNQHHNGYEYRSTRRKRKNKYSITDIFASNSSFILDHEYNEDDICNLILNNSTQTQTKIKFLKSIWPHILRVTTRVLKGSKFRCPICLDEDLSIGRITECGHCFCGSCLLHHLFASVQSNSTYTKPPLFPEIKDNDANYNFTDLFGHCPLCHEYVSFEHTRPLTVIRCRDYKVNDMIDMVLIERRKGEQPQFSMNRNHHSNISTFRKFETEKHEIKHLNKELHAISQLIKSSDPIYEAPYLRLLAIHVKQYKAYITQQRAEYNIIERNNHNHNEFEEKEISAEPYSCFNNGKGPILAKPTNPTSHQQQIQQNEQLQQQQYRYRKKKYVYQSTDGQLIFLHPHNYNMLKHDVNYHFDHFPSILSNCKIIQIERYEQSYDLRRKYPFLAFIPVDVSFSFVEVDLSSIVSESTLKYFEKSLIDRQQYRMKQEQLLEEEMKRQQILEEQRVALQRQKYARPQIDIHDYSEFPSLSTPSKTGGNSTDESNSDHSGNVNGNGKDHESQQNEENGLNRKSSPLHRSWSDMMVNKPQRSKSLESPKFIAVNQKKGKSGNVGSGGSNGSGHKKKRRRGGRNRKKNKDRDNV